VRKIKAEYLLLLISVFLCFNCGLHWSENHSILEKSPYIDYGTNSTPEIVDGQHGFGFGLGGNYIYTMTDADTSINVTALHGLIRKRLGNNAELGFSGYLMIKDTTSSYLTLDVKFKLPKTSIIMCPDIGFGTAFGSKNSCFDIRFSMLFGYPMVENRITPYFVPKIIWLRYPYRTEYDIPFIDIYYATCTIYGVGAGLCFTLLESTEQHGRTQKLRIKPEINYVMGQEPKVDQINFYVLQFGLQMLYEF